LRLLKNYKLLSVFGIGLTSPGTKGVECVGRGWVSGRSGWLGGADNSAMESSCLQIEDCRETGRGRGWSTRSVKRGHVIPTPNMLSVVCSTVSLYHKQMTCRPMYYN